MKHNAVHQNRSLKVDSMRLLVIVVLFLQISLYMNSTQACATCLCGDPTITMMGTEKPFAGRTRISVDYLNRSESLVEDNELHEISEQRLIFNVSYAVNEKWVLGFSQPMLDKRVNHEDAPTDRTDGLGDTDLSAKWVLGGDKEPKPKNLWGMLFGIRLPTAVEKKVDKVSLDFDAQVGTGETTPSIGVWYGHYQQPWFFYTSAVFKDSVGEGFQDFSAGNVVLVTGLMQYALNYHWGLQFGLDSRFTNKDHFADHVQQDSGSFLLMASPGIVWTPAEDIVLNLRYQIPAIEKNDFEQKEDNTLMFGVAFDL